MDPVQEEVRQQITRAVQSGSYGTAEGLLRDLARQPLTGRLAAFVVAWLEEIDAHLDLPELRVAVSRSYTVEPLVPLLRARCLAAGWNARVHLGDFGTYAQDLLDPTGPLVRFRPDLLLLALRTADLLPDLWRDEPGHDALRDADRAATEIESWITTFRKTSTAHVVMQNFELPPTLPRGVHDAQDEANARDAVWEFNRRLRALCRQQTGVFVLDYQGLVERHGRRAWHDERMWQMARLPIAGNHLIDLVDEWMRFVHPLTGRLAKALVVDLDDTLWGGVVGEDGLEGIRIGADISGAPFLALQEAILGLRRRGILLAICSKNNPADALDVLENHPEMKVRPTDFSAMRINWQDKAKNLREIAAELNIGLDSLAFLDDSHVEREWVRDQLPEVFVVECPENPMARVETLLGSPIFERVSISAEDEARPQLYAAERHRSESLESAGSLEEFLASLEMSVESVEADSMTIPRIAQLTQKTNQFNLTTHRYSTQEVETLAADPQWRVLAIRVKDRFGDSGIVGVAMLSFHQATCELDTFLLSCRVIGRGVETALLWHCLEVARAQNCQFVDGIFIPTRKNQPASTFLADHGFEAASEQKSNTRWRLDLDDHKVAVPDWIDFVPTVPVESSG